jgi:phosphoribosylformimino-5-aminoimidazole carboxamide ribotide isomerase
MEIIPAIDLINGQCVRLEKGNYSKKQTYHTDPLKVAKSFEEVGIRRLHLVDLDGAKSQKIINLPVLKRISDNTTLQIDFGGGIKSREQVELAFANGAKQVTGGSIAAKDRNEFTSWISSYGSDRIILGADVSDLHIMVSGWQEATNLHIYDFLEYYLELGLIYVVCTDISKDGMLQGPSMELYKDLMQRFPTIRLIASGGVSGIEDVEHLEQLGIHGTIIGKAIYEGKISLDQLAKLC